MEKQQHPFVEKSNNLWFSLPLLLLALYWTWSLYASGTPITGPFIFGDELTYFSFARSIFMEGNFFKYTQYGPFYCLLISPFFALSSIAKTYQLIRIFNIVIYILTVVPTYFLAKKLFINPWLRFALPVCVLFSPFSGLVYLTWAEPLYIFLFYSFCLIFCLFIQNPTLIKGFIFGILLSLLYYTKPPVGFITEIAVFLTFAFYLLSKWKVEQLKFKALLFFSLLTCILSTLPWMLHYLHVGVSIIGYPAATKSLVLRIAQNGYLHFTLDVLRGIFYQFSYFFIGSWGIIGIGFYLLLTKWKRLNRTEQCILLFLLLTVLGLVALSAFGMASWVDFRMPQGRYFSLFFPLMILYPIDLLLKNRDKNKPWWATSVIVLLMIIAYIASPLFCRSPLAFNSMPDLSLFIYLSDHGNIIWRATMESPHFVLRATVPLFFGFFALIVLWFNQRKWVIPILTIIVILGVFSEGLAEKYYLSSIGISEFHDIYFYLKKKNINFDTVVFDKKMEMSNAPFLAQFWLNRVINNYQSQDEFLKPSKKSKFLYFITDEKLKSKIVYSSRRNGTYKIYLHPNLDSSMVGMVHMRSNVFSKRSRP